MREARGHPERSLIAEISFLSAMLRRAQIRIGTRPLSEWLRGENRFEAKQGRPPNVVKAKAAGRSEIVSGSAAAWQRPPIITL